MLQVPLFKDYEKWIGVDPGILGVNAGAGTAIVIFMFSFKEQLKSTDWISIMMMPMFGLVGDG